MRIEKRTQKGLPNQWVTFTNEYQIKSLEDL